MQPRHFHDGAEDGLEALESLDPESIHSFSDLLTAMKKNRLWRSSIGGSFRDTRHDGGGSGLYRRPDTFRSHDHCENGENHQYHDRPRHDPSRRVDRSPYGPWDE